MNADIKAQWVQALRSGDYTKGKGTLKSEHDDGGPTYCCLGVLCELSPFESRKSGAWHSWDDSLSYLPCSVRDWAGLDTHNPKVSYLGGESDLADVNDRTDATFFEIADLIEAHL